TAPREVTADGLYDYFENGAPIYRGAVTFDQGQMAGAFIVPSEALLGDHGRVRAYLEGVGEPGRVTDDDGAGDLRAGVTPGSAGPSIALSFPGGATSVRPDAVLQIRIADPSGILITDHVPLNGILVTVDGSSTSRADVTSSFHYDDNSYQSGSASFALPGLAL